MDNPQFLYATMVHFLDGFKAGPVKSYADLGGVKNVDRGEYLFKSRCAACHTVGKGDTVGPDFAGVTKRRDHAWLLRYIQRPDRVLASGDPIAKALFARYRAVRMPDLDLRDGRRGNPAPLHREADRARRRPGREDVTLRAIGPARFRGPRARPACGGAARGRAPRARSRGGARAGTNRRDATTASDWCPSDRSSFPSLPG